MNKVRVLAVALDFDGTILDSNSLKAECFGQIFAPFGQTSAQYATTYHFRHLSQPRRSKISSIAQELGLILNDRELEELSQLFGDLVLDQILECSLVPGVSDFLEWAKDKWPLYVCSATPHGELKQILRSIGLEGYFTGVFGHPTSKEEALDQIATSLGCSSNQVLMIGDSDADREAAINVGAGFHLVGDEPLTSYQELILRDGMFR